MKLKLFIDRPILSIVISIAIMVAGVLGLISLSVEQYPDIAPPTISVSTSYSGASAEAVQKSVIVPLEEAINGVENMTYMTSTASNTGSADITIYFKQGSDPDMAAVNVQNRVSTATSLLPAEVTKVGVTTNKRQSNQLKIFGLSSPNGTYDETFLTNYMNINIAPQLLRISGVGEVNVMGGDYAMRVWLKPDVMARYGLEPSDVENALSSQNVEASAGSFGENSDNVFQYTLKYRGRLEAESEFEEIVIKAYSDGRVLKLKDIATVELGAQDYSYTGGVNGAPGTMCMINQTAGTNANEIIKQIDAYLEELSSELPNDMEIVTLMSTKDFLDASIAEVIKTLLEALLLVILVVYIFLQNPRSTLIPTISIVVSLVGTFAALYVAGFSINLLTLFALVLAIGIIVDDAVIVVEAVQARFDEGYRSPYKAAVDAMSGISSAIVSTTLVFMAVFVPVTFFGGTSGTFYTQFGVTMAVAVGISAVNALTLSPALCALFLRPNEEYVVGGKNSFSTRFRHAFDTSFKRILYKYKSGAKFFVKHKWVAWGALALASAGLVWCMATSKTSLVPNEDTGTIFVSLDASAGNTLQETAEIMADVEKELQKIPEIENYNKVAGFSMGASGSSHGMFIIKLKNWDERQADSSSVDGISNRIYAATANIKNASIFVFAPPMIAGYGTGNSFEVYLQDRAGKGVDSLYSVTQDFIAALNKRPEVKMSYTAFSPNYPQYRVDIDEVKCQRAGITTEDVLNVLSGYFGSVYASNFNRFTKLYRVILQAPADYRKDMQSLNNIFVKTDNGMTPVSQFVKLSKTYGAETLTRFNMFSSINVSGMPADGYSSGDIINAIKEVASESLPTGYGYEFSGMTREEQQLANSNTTVIVYCICFLFIYLILCGLYESLFIPFSVILSVPFGLLGSFIFAKLWGIENNIYMQTGLIMLIGLLAKTSILMTEYAVERRKAGMTLTQAAISAASVRFRPILMTVLAMVFGLLPLMFASSVGANGNRSLGVGAVGGILVGTVFLLFVTPVFFIVFQHIEERVMGKRKLDRLKEESQLEAQQFESILNEDSKQ
ncbi:MAG: efflux RND transporter permease subunit [Bacteroidales bacterium]|nr:efflux RND transporter permease subunit [Bacteroidales bacterium]